MSFSFKKLSVLVALLFAVTAVSAVADFDDHHGFRPGPGFHPGFHPGFGPGPGFRPGFGPGPGFRPGFCGPGWGPGFAPGFVPGPGYGPVFVPGPGFVPGPAYAPGYVYTCFAVGNAGTPFYATAYDPNLAQQQAFAYCASTGQYCQPTGCR